MSIGRSEKRIARTESIEVCLQDEPKLNEKTLTENVSAHGARVLMQQKLQPGQRVLVSSPKEGMHSQARIIYCPARPKYPRSCGAGYIPGISTGGRNLFGG